MQGQWDQVPGQQTFHYTVNGTRRASIEQKSAQWNCHLFLGAYGEQTAVTSQPDEHAARAYCEREVAAKHP